MTALIGLVFLAGPFTYRFADKPLWSLLVGFRELVNRLCNKSDWSRGVGDGATVGELLHCHLQAEGDPMLAETTVKIN